jgi:hypothetical protein
VRVPPYQRRRGSRSFARWGHWPAKRRAGHAPAANVNKPKGHEPGGTLQEFRWDCRTFASAGAVPGVFHEGWATAGLCIQIFSRYKDFCLSGPHRSQLFAAAVEEAAVEEATAAALKEAGAVVSNPARARELPVARNADSNPEYLAPCPWPLAAMRPFRSSLGWAARRRDLWADPRTRAARPVCCSRATSTRSA